MHGKPGRTNSRGPFNSSLAPASREFPQLGAALVYGLGYSGGNGWIVLFDVLSDSMKIFSGRNGPTDAHQDRSI